MESQIAESGTVENMASRSAAFRPPQVMSGSQEALKQTDLCAKSTAHDRFQEWVDAGVFLKLWQTGLERFDELQGIDWTWLSMDGAMTKAPLGGEKNRAQSHRSRQTRGQAQPADGGAWGAGWIGG